MELVTGFEPAHLVAREPNGRVTSVGLIPVHCLSLLYHDL